LKWLDMERNEGDIEEIPWMDFFKAFLKLLENDKKWFLDIKRFEDGVRNF
jgi:hypothetical protein